MNVYGELTKAQLENLTADPTLSSVRKGRIWYRTDLTAAFVDTGGTAQRFPWELFSRTANPAASGIVRFAKTDTLAWRNNANGADLPLGIDASDNLSYNSHAFLSSTGIVPVAAGGTNLASYSVGDILYATGATTLAKLPIGTANQLLRTNAGATAPEWATVTATYTAPTIQRFTATGSTAGYIFTVTAANATVGATYTNNGNTYTVMGTIAGGTTLFCSQAAAPTASGTLTKSGGTGDATITFSVALAAALYTKPANVLYIRIKAIGGGGGGGGSTANAGTAGKVSWFGATAFVSAGNGSGGVNNGDGGVGQANTISGVTATIHSVLGGYGGCGQNNGTNTINLTGGNGGNGFFGGGGGTSQGAAGRAGTANSGGGGAGGSQGSATTGGGGGAGSYIDVMISNPQSTYLYVVGTGGAGGSAGGQAGGTGADGQVVVEEYYQ